MDKSTGDSERLLRLLSLQTDGLLDNEQSKELIAMVSASKEARQIYIAHMFLHSLMHRAARLTDAVPVLPEELSGSAGTLPDDGSQLGRPTRTLMLDFLGNVFRGGTDFLSRSLVLTLLLAVGLPGILFLLLVLHVTRQPGPVTPLAKITRTHECVWSEGTTALSTGAGVFAGEQLRLTEGLLEITFARGAKVLLEGPATFNVTDAAQGFLHNGSLVAKVQKGAEGFTIQTPAVAVVDLGTEFGVRVDDERGTAEVEVFQGKVELRATAEEGPSRTLRQHLVAGRAARVEVTDRQGALPIIREITPAVVSFVRQIPQVPKRPLVPIKPSDADKPEAAIVADFSGGEGNAQVDQFPGVAGSGWAAGWNVGEAGELKCITSIEQANPLLGGGKYLRVLVERQSGGSGACTCTAVDRRLALTNGVDLTKPHVVSFNFRIDVLNRFGEASDRLSICNRNVSQMEYEREGRPSSGWHICMVGKGNKYAKSGNWALLRRDKKGKPIGVDSGIPPREGNTYSFRILVDPPARQWTPSIAVNGGKWIAFEPMGMRSKGTAKKNGYWPFLYFYCEMEGGNKGEDVEKIGFSVDSIRITPAPAPQAGSISGTGRTTRNRSSFMESWSSFLVGPGDAGTGGLGKACRHCPSDRTEQGHRFRFWHFMSFSSIALAS